MTTTPTDSPLTRRQALNIFGAAAGTVAWLGYDRGARAATTCAATVEKTIGPYFVEEDLERSDIRIDPSDGTTQPGVPLRLDINVLQTDASCTPAVGVRVDVWHASAAGLYSDEAANNTSGKKYLRGDQITDENGAVSFLTVYPGWYSGRTIHIHFRVRAFDGDETVFDFVSQIFFNETINNTVMTQAPYDTRGTRDRTNAQDNIYAASLIATTVADGSGGYVATMNVGITGLPAGTGGTTTTTSTTLPDTGCSSDATFDATICQANALSTTVTTLLSDGGLRRHLLKISQLRLSQLLTKADEAVAAGKSARAGRLLRRAGSALSSFQTVLKSRMAQQNASATILATLTALAQATASQVGRLRATLG